MSSDEELEMIDNDLLNEKIKAQAKSVPFTFDSLSATNRAPLVAPVEDIKINLLIPPSFNNNHIPSCLNINLNRDNNDNHNNNNNNNNHHHHPPIRNPSDSLLTSTIINHRNPDPLDTDTPLNHSCLSNYIRQILMGDDHIKLNQPIETKTTTTSNKHVRSELYTNNKRESYKRRKITDLHPGESWKCQRIGCYKVYHRNSHRSIKAHKSTCTFPVRNSVKNNNSGPIKNTNSFPSSLVPVLVQPRFIVSNKIYQSIPQVFPQVNTSLPSNLLQPSPSSIHSFAITSATSLPLSLSNHSNSHIPDYAANIPNQYSALALHQNPKYFIRSESLAVPHLPQSNHHPKFEPYPAPYSDSLLSDSRFLTHEASQSHKDPTNHDQNYYHQDSIYSQQPRSVPTYSNPTSYSPFRFTNQDSLALGHDLSDNTGNQIHPVTTGFRPQPAFLSNESFSGPSNFAPYNTNHTSFSSSSGCTPLNRDTFISSSPADSLSKNNNSSRSSSHSDEIQRKPLEKKYRNINETISSISESIHHYSPNWNNRSKMIDACTNLNLKSNDDNDDNKKNNNNHSIKSIPFLPKDPFYYRNNHPHASNLMSLTDFQLHKWSTTSNQ